jgi:hypothetical protein
MAGGIPRLDAGSRTGRSVVDRPLAGPLLLERARAFATIAPLVIRARKNGANDKSFAPET